MTAEKPAKDASEDDDDVDCTHWDDGGCVACRRRQRQAEVILPDRSVSDEVNKCDGERSSSHWFAFYVAQPPLLVLFPIHHDHLTLGEG